MGQIMYSLIGHSKDSVFYAEYYGKSLKSLC